jgi:hypothetical protein
VGYDIEFIAMARPADAGMPIEPGAAAGLIARSAATLDADAVKTTLLATPGCKPGPEGSIDYLGSGLSYARLTVRARAVHVENNCGAKDILKLQAALEKTLGPVFILDLQSRQLHDGASFAQWWARPL